MDKRKKGRRGEEKAIAFLIKKDYIILERNFYCREGELDIIARQDDYLVFVEVKMIGNYEPENLEFIVDEGKQSRLRKAAQHYLQQKGLVEETKLRFDIIALLKDGRILHLENAF